MTFTEFEDILRSKPRLTDSLLPNVYDPEGFFSFQTEEDTIIINADSLALFTRFCRGIVESSSLKTEAVLPKIILKEKYSGQDENGTSSLCLNTRSSVFNSNIGTHFSQNSVHKNSNKNHSQNKVGIYYFILYFNGGYFTCFLY